MELSEKVLKMSEEKQMTEFKFMMVTIENRTLSVTEEEMMKMFNTMFPSSLYKVMENFGLPGEFIRGVLADYKDYLFDPMLNLLQPVMFDYFNFATKGQPPRYRKPILEDKEKDALCEMFDKMGYTAGDE